MKILIFLIIIAIIFSWWFWNWRKTQAEADLARRKILERQRQLKKEEMRTEGVTWPTVGLSTSSDLEERADSEEPSMTTIEFVPPEQMT
jgi:regulatory protein YycH of two-component signal transduction system YycFG